MFSNLMEKSVIDDVIELFIPYWCRDPDTLIVISHGSGGIGSAEKSIAQKFITEGYNVALLDYFTKHGIDSLGWIDHGPFMDRHAVSFAEMFDINLPKYKNIIHIGFSLGGYYGLYNAQKFIKNYCFYPGIIAVTDELIKKDYSNTTVFLPTNDTWCTNYDQFRDMCENPPNDFVINDCYHGFMLHHKEREILITKYNTTQRILSNKEFGQLRPNHYTFALLFPGFHNEKIRLQSNKKYSIMCLNYILEDINNI